MKSVRTPRTLGSVPNKPRTQHRSVRIDDADWADLEAVAELNGLDRAKILNAYVQWHLRRPRAALPDRPTKEQVAQVVERREEEGRAADERPATP